MRSIVLALGASFSILGGTIGAAVAADRALADSVPLSAAVVAPTFGVILAPHRSVSVPLNCADSASDVSAYHWNGRALGPQHWTGEGSYWLTRHGRRVTFDGLTFRNRTTVPVFVAVWC